MNKIILSLCISLSFFSCAHNQSAVNSKNTAASDILPHLREQSLAIKTVKGHVWIRSESPEGKFSFPADIAIDRTEAVSKLRLEVYGPFGTTAFLILLNQDHGRNMLTWIDYKHSKTFHFKDQWHGLELTNLPEVILGIMSVKDLDSSSLSDRGGGRFELNSNDFNIFYNTILTTISDRHVVGSIEGFARKARNSNREPLHFNVNYSGISDSKDFFIPKEIELLSNMSILLKISWRDCQWNESLPAEAFLNLDSQ